MLNFILNIFYYLGVFITSHPLLFCVIFFGILCLILFRKHLKPKRNQIDVDEYYKILNDAKKSVGQGYYKEELECQNCGAKLRAKYAECDYCGYRAKRETGED